MTELFCIADRDCSRDTKMTDDVLLEKFLDCRRACVGDRLRFNPFGEIFNCYNGEDVIALS
jgi:hypothetical protein